jgi:hypothetical protein
VNTLPSTTSREQIKRAALEREHRKQPPGPLIKMLLFGPKFRSSSDVICWSTDASRPAPPALMFLPPRFRWASHVHYPSTTTSCPTPQTPILLLSTLAFSLLLPGIFDCGRGLFESPMIRFSSSCFSPSLRALRFRNFASTYTFAASPLPREAGVLSRQLVV